MRWLALALLGACSFTPGSYATSDANGSGSDTDGAVDTNVATDADVDTVLPVGPFTRLIDIVDGQVTGTHTSFPLLVSITADWLKSVGNGGTVARDDAFDLWFSSDMGGQTKLAHELEDFDETAGKLVAWVKLPTLEATTTLYIHYGDTALTTDPQMKAAVWPGFAAVVHLAGSGDSTAQNTATADNLTASDGKIGPAQSFNGTTSIANMGSNAIIDNVFVGGATLEAWIRPLSVGENSFGRIFDKADGWIILLSGTTLSFQHAGASGSLGAWYAPASSITFNAWQHVAVTYDKDSDANNPKIYINGASVAVSETDAPSAPLDDDKSFNLYIGNRADGARTFDGILDELRISTGARSDGWIATEVANQSNPSAFYTISDPL
jgi:MSHA biogenesis protein MshQ